MDSRPLQPNILRAEKDLWGLELLRTQLNNLPIGQVVVRYVLLFPFFVLLVVLADWDCHVALHFFDFLYDFELCCRVENVPTPAEKQLQVLGHISSADVDPLYRVIDGESFEHRTAMAHAVSAIEDQPRSFTPRVKTQNCLLLEKNLGSSELFEENVRGFDSVVEWVEWRLCQQDRVLLGLHLQLIEDMAPKGLHIVPVGDDSVFYWVSQLQYAFVFIL